MDLLDLYHKSLHQGIDEEDLEWVHEVAEEHPYFALPYFLMARQSGKEEALFVAATHAPNRSLLRNYMEGRASYTPSTDTLVHRTEAKSEKPIVKDTPYLGTNHHSLFSLVDFNELSQEAIDPQASLSIHPFTNPHKRNEFLNVKVKELTLKHLYLVQKIQQDIQKNHPKKSVIPFSDFASPSEKEGYIFDLEEERIEAKSGAEGMPEVSDMLEQFLQNRPSPKELLQRVEAYEDEYDEESISQDEEMVTETLARLHLMQKNYGEALRFYRKLRLLFPEKSAYFDVQIEQIEQKI